MILFTCLMILGLVAAVGISLLGHPAIYRAVFKRGGKSLDHKDSAH